jgi:hypothetical protein
MSDRYILSYVNFTDGDEKHYDQEFPTLITLIAFVNANHPNASSYQIIVVCGERAA